MFIPSWVFWVVYTIATFAIPMWIASKTSAYDFATPLMSGAVFFLFIAFAAGFWISKLF